VMQHALLRVAHAYKNAEGVERQVCTGHTPGAKRTPDTWLCARSCERGARCECILGVGEHLHRFLLDQIHKFEEYSRKAGG
jgi:hypothetical protein